MKQNYQTFYFSLTGFERDTLQEKVRTLQGNCTELQERIHQMDSQISETKVCLDKEKGKYNNACRQQEVSLVARATDRMLQKDVWLLVDTLFTFQGHPHANILFLRS